MLFFWLPDVMCPKDKRSENGIIFTAVRGTLDKTGQFLSNHVQANEMVQYPEVSLCS